ncbi:MAG: transcription-repair coupling factor, partial [Spirochaetae bacterium HGW-Spirochaetae-10]
YTAQIQRISGILKSESVPHEAVEWSGPDTKLSSSARDSSGGSSRIVLVQSLRETGFELPEERLYLWTDSDIFGRSYKKRMRFKKTGSAPIDSYLDLREGDVIVHINHGVGRFVKLERMKAAGRERDFLVLEYAEQDRLFVPLDQISMVQKYVAPESNPQLDHLGRASFKKIREKVEKNIEAFAEELIQIYAARAKKQGYAFPADTVWQEEFEAEFPFDETPDQLMAIQAAKEDMEAPRPMDRLICGDVGYGKTEVAIRTVFKAVMGGKQAVVICPTTILALQHFKNFRERFANFPVRVDWVSRFRTPGEIRRIKESLASGEVDVVIGTHALLAKDVKIRNLGLLVIDEEQRFGVVHKEALKKLKTQVDVLTLSATPIPRTLHLSLTGIRDLSVIQTPPRDRKPVQTFVLEDSDAALIEAVHRELERGGQIFYLHNRIQSLDMVGARLRMLLPELRFTTLHGQMHEDDIEQILLDFTERKFDLLLTTAIIENGIDIPNVNTLIVDRADQFGLSQLYQIRGRVGRSSRQAYAYFFHQGSKVLTEQAMKRLNTLLEYQELGSGFKVAMRDLEIRGAGNVLGKEQSGDIIQVGYELYIKLLDNAVKRLKGEELEIEVRCTVNLNTDFFLSEEYIEDTRQRIEFYKRFEAARTEEEVAALADEMKDRFGPPDKAGEVFVLVERIRTLGSLCGFENIYEEGELIHFKAGESFRVPIQHMIEILKKNLGFFVRDGKNNVLYFKAPQASQKGPSKQPVSHDAILQSLLVAMRALTAPLQEQLAAKAG